MPVNSQHVAAHRNARKRSELLNSMETEYSIYFQDVRNMQKKVNDYFSNTITCFLGTVVIFLGGIVIYLLITKKQVLPYQFVAAWVLICMSIAWFRFYIAIKPTKKDYLDHSTAQKMKEDVKWKKIMQTFNEAGVGGIF